MNKKLPALRKITKLAKAKKAMTILAPMPAEAMIIWVVKFSREGQRYAYRVLQTIQMKLILYVSGQSGPFYAMLI